MCESSHNWQTVSARRRQEAKLRVSSRKEQPDLPDGSCDLVVCRHLVWTLPNPAGALLQWQRVLDAGGRIAVFESHQTAPKILQGYDSIYEQLPFYGGRPAEQLEAFFQQQGLRDVAVEPLMESILWGFEPTHERFVVIGVKP